MDKSIGSHYSKSLLSHWNSPVTSWTVCGWPLVAPEHFHFCSNILAADGWISRISQASFLQFSDRFTMTITSTNVRKSMLHHTPVGMGLSLHLKQKWMWNSYLHFQNGLVWGDIWCGPCSPVCRAQLSFLSAQWVTAPVVNIKHYSPSPQSTYVFPINKKQNRVNLILF